MWDKKGIYQSTKTSLAANLSDCMSQSKNCEFQLPFDSTLDFSGFSQIMCVQSHSASRLPREPLKNVSKILTAWQDILTGKLTGITLANSVEFTDCL